MNDKDFVHYQELSNRDPVVQQLCKIIFALQDRWDDAVYGLDINEYGGIDGHWTIGEYIRHMERELEIAEDDIHNFREKINELEHRLKTRTVAELLLEADQEARTAKSKADTHFNEIMHLRRAVDDLTEKMNTWTAISKEYN